MQLNILKQYSYTESTDFSDLNDLLNPLYSYLRPSIVMLWDNYLNQSFFIQSPNYLLGKLYPNKEAAYWSLTSKKILAEDELIEAIDQVRYYDQSTSEIRFIPSDCLPDTLDNSIHFEISPESDEYYDYIYDINATTACIGGQYEDMRRHVRRFFNIYGKDTKIEILEGWDNIQKYKVEAYNLFDSWTHSLTEGSLDYAKEEQAFNTFFNGKNEHAFNDILLVILTYKGKVVAFSVNEKIDDNTVLNHFHKANLNLSGISHYMFYSCASMFSQRGYQYLNFQEDCGVGGLRAFKKKMRPLALMELSKLRF